MKYSEQLEREAEDTRAQLAGTLDELRARISPGQVVDELMDYAREGAGGEFVRNLKRQVVRNPLPVALMGAGLGWLLLAGRKSADASERVPRHERWDEATMRAREQGGAAVERVKDWSSESANAVRDAASRAKETSKSAASAIGDKSREAGVRMSAAASSAATSIKEAASSTGQSAAAAYDAAGRAAASMADSAASLGRGASDTGRTFMNFCREQPLVLAGLGIALGAAIGALLPATETEDRLMGEASDRAKDQARSLAEEQYGKAKATAEHAVDAAQNEMSKQGEAGRSGGQGVQGAAHETTLVPDSAEFADNSSDKTQSADRGASEKLLR